MPFERSAPSTRRGDPTGPSPTAARTKTTVRRCTVRASTRTFANVATTNAYGTDVTVAMSGGRLSGFVGGSGFRQVSDAANLSPGFSARTFGWAARTHA